MKYNCLIPKSEILDCDLNHFPVENLYEVLMVDKETGEIRLMKWGHQYSIESAMAECNAHMSRNYEILDAWPLVERLYTGTVLWWDARDGYGIIVDENNNETYFDSSVVDFEPKSQDFVQFVVNKNIKHTRCGREVRKVVK